MTLLEKKQFDKETLDNTGEDPRKRPELVLGGADFESVSEDVAKFTLQKVTETPRGWFIGMIIALHLLLMFKLLLAYLVLTGVGVWGNNNSVAWGFPITNFVFWVGIGHAGTLISAILFLFRQNWRTSINRFAEAMTIFAVACAGMFPLFHTGRPWFAAYWLTPYPNQMGMWPQFRSPLAWDVFAVGTYATVSTLFWLTGMVPDLATLRDRAKLPWQKFIYGIASLGWNGSNRHWHRFERAYLLLAALATPLVLSVHSVVSFDFAVAQVPGWHTTIFPPYFVAGAVFSGFGMVITLSVPAREWLGLKHMITLRHLENMNKVILATGSIVGYAYIMELFIAWYSGVAFEQFAFMNRITGPTFISYWIMFSCNVIIPQLFWLKRVRTSIPAMFIISLLVNVGMWFERYVIIVTSLTRVPFLPSGWQQFVPTWVDLLTFVGSFGLFFTLFLMFCRFLPVISIAEVKSVMPQAHGGHGHGEGDEKH